MTTPALDHATHDPLLIAGHLDGTLDARDATRVHDWLRGCAACATLRSDLAALAVATREMAPPTRPRDFTLTAADAQRATSRGWRRWLTGVGSTRDTITRPLALGLTTLGLAGLVITAIPSVSLPASSSSAGAAPETQIEMTDTGAGATSVQAPIDVADPSAIHLPDGAAVPMASESDGSAVTDGSGDAGRGTDKQAGREAASPSSATESPSLLVIASVALLLTGLALALLRWGARRLGDG